MTSEVRADPTTAERVRAASELGTRLAAVVYDPERLVPALESGLARLADPVDRTGLLRFAPTAPDPFGVRTAVLAALEKSLRSTLDEASPAVTIYLAERLQRSGHLETRLLAGKILRGVLRAEPERSWQLIRRLARRAEDWISVDTLADTVAEGILLERYRWAELEQLIYSPHPWERRLVGATLARLPFELPPKRRETLPAEAGLALIGSLLGDAEPDVQRSLSWALRSWRNVDRAATEAFLRREADEAARLRDGNRAWVLRDALSGFDGSVVGYVKERLAGLRRSSAAPSTSRAAETAAAFRGLPDAHELAEAPLA